MSKYRIIVRCYDEEEDDYLDPFFVDFDSMPDALNSKASYEKELNLRGQPLFAVVGPDILED